jgi:hypothetical protein
MRDNDNGDAVNAIFFDHDVNFDDYNIRINVSSQVTLEWGGGQQ